MRQVVARFIPTWVGRQGFARWARDLKALPRLASVLLSAPCPRGEVAVFYGHRDIPGRNGHSHGGMVKLQWMQEEFPNSPRRFNILYLVSSGMPSGVLPMVWLARRKGVRLVWNQDGVAYPGWYGPGWERLNAVMAKGLHAADHVFYQSEFAKSSSDRYLGERRRDWQVLHNCVDTRLFTPSESDPDPHHLILLCAGSILAYYRLESALQTVARAVRPRLDIRLLIAGRLAWSRDEATAMAAVRRLAVELGVSERISFLGPYSQSDAPDIFRRAHVLLHTKYNDPCPSVVVEAMACGLPVVYSRSGGVPELVGLEAGIGVACQPSWEREVPPDPDGLTQAVLEVAQRRRQFAEAARERAVQHFDIRPWVERHREVFRNLVE